MTDADVVVAGAGLAGLACAFELATAGREVVGGRTSSWDEQGMPVESGLHRMLGIYLINNASMVATLAEPYVAPTWWPSTASAAWA